MFSVPTARPTSRTSPPIPGAMRDQIFHKYVRIPSAPAAEVSTGRGLGLAFCRIAVLAHGGTIAVEDGEGGRTVFRVSLPAAR